MTDSPVPTTPADPAEQPLLDELLACREQLCLLKSDKSSYIRSEDVCALYKRVIAQVPKLNELRAARDGGPPAHPSRADRVLEDCFQLLSLFYLTIGRTREAPAAYALASTMRRLLEHLREVALFSAKDLQSLGERLGVLRADLAACRERHSPHLVTLLEERLDSNEVILKELRERIPNLCDVMSPKYEQLVSILRSMAAANTRCHFPTQEILDFQRQLKALQACVVDGKYVLPDGHVPGNYQCVVALLDKVVAWSDIVLERKGSFDPRFQDLYDRLRCVRSKLEKLTLTQAWALRETDLYGYQRELDQIDEARVDGNFLDAEGKPADLYEQRTLLYLIRRSYAYIWQLLIASEPVSEALLPIYNQLNTLRKCLAEVRRNGGVASTRELYPYAMKLGSIDNMRKDGKFMVGPDVPEGQASVAALLAECFDHLRELRVAIDASESAAEDAAAAAAAEPEVAAAAAVTPVAAAPPAATPVIESQS